ncbi:hypothetical protein [Bosea sp. RAC05]|uniref:hypothetical protein n=1 Tax=Bosea sp. RAC05 TaxID=1842539 RepID=UPI0012377A36|nr:hypothetical protein [Bosea sp. RAC05]
MSLDVTLLGDQGPPAAGADAVAGQAGWDIPDRGEAAVGALGNEDPTISGAAEYLVEGEFLDRQ